MGAKVVFHLLRRQACCHQRTPVYSVETRKWEGTLDTLHNGNVTSAQSMYIQVSVLFNTQPMISCVLTTY